MSPRWTAVTVVVLLAVLAGCRPGSAGGADAAGTCLGRSSSPSTSAAAGAVPDLALPCFDGSGTVHVRQVSGPAVVNLWASWCGPCLTELPVFQRFADRAGGQVAVVGVNTSDDHAKAEAVIGELALRFPMLYDARNRLLTGVGRSALPATLFVTADGRIAHVYNGEALDDATLSRLVSDHLRVEVPA
jgi:thiol-disulfide isomerase/thioredoxin